MAFSPAVAALIGRLALALTLTLPGLAAAQADAVEEVTTPYHHIRVVEDNGFRSINFDNAMQSRMSLADPLQGHFEYIEFFFTPWIWNAQMTNVLAVGLGGASIQRLLLHYAPQTAVDTAEIDAYVVRVAKEWFELKESPKHQIHVADGRAFLRQTGASYDAILMDAYVSGPYGSTLPHHLATKEFFALAASHLTTNGVLAYNAVGPLQGASPGIVGALYRTMKAVFPQVYLFPARESQNVVLVATRARYRVTSGSVIWKAGDLARTKRVTLPGFANRVSSVLAEPPAGFERSPILTDDFAPVEGLASQNLKPDHDRHDDR